MKRNIIFTFVILTLCAFAFQTASAQITITIPKIPKIKKEKPKTTDNSQTSDNQTNDNQTNDRQTNNNQSQENRAEEDSPPPKATDECESNPVARLAADEIAKMIEDIDAFTPDRGWLYSGYPTYKYLLFAVSPSARKGWQNDFKDMENCPKIVSGLDRLAESAAKKLPLFKPDPKEYAFRTPAEERLMKGKINELASHKIHHIGVRQQNWLIEKNSLGIPTARYKHGMVWVRYTPNDHSFCRAYYINIIQDYAGGGTYGASYANFIDDVLVGCPAAK